MCLIVDVNVGGEVLFDDGDDRYLPIRKALNKQRTRLVYGGRLTREYQAHGALWRALVAFDRAGRARKLPDHDVDEREVEIRESGGCLSDDWHILALAQLGNVRLICTNDAALHNDFTNKRLLNSPRGNVYQHRTHEHLIRKHCQHI